MKLLLLSAQGPIFHSFTVILVEQEKTLEVYPNVIPMSRDVIRLTSWQREETKFIYLFFYISLNISLRRVVNRIVCEYDGRGVSGLRRCCLRRMIYLDSVNKTRAAA